MTVEVVNSVVEKFLRDPAPQVLVIKGRWGVGKTYAWKRLIEVKKDLCARRVYSYVSLFGVATIADVRSELFLKSQEMPLIGEEVDFDTINEKWRSLGAGALKWLRGASRGALEATQYGKPLSAAMDALSWQRVRDMIICLDDLERTGGSLSSEAILGLVSELKEDRNCKVVLIFNEEQLRDRKEILDLYREKVVDVELVFAPTPEEALQHAITSDFKHRELFAKYASRLKIDNIRVLRKTRRLIDIIFQEIGDTHTSVIEQVVCTTVLFCWCHFERREGRFGLETLHLWNKLIWKFNTTAKGEAEDPVHLKWGETLREYGFSEVDELDLAIREVVQNGYTDGTSLKAQAKQLSESRARQDLESAFTRTWQDYFHDTLGDNQEKLIEALDQSFRECVKTITPINVNGTVQLFRELGADDKADKLIAFYVENRADQPGLFDLENSPFGGDVTDVKLREAFKTAHVSHRKLPSLLEAASHIAEGKGWNREHGEVMRLATVDDFYALFKGEHGRPLPYIVKACVQFGGSPEDTAAGNRAKEALVRIAKESKLNAIRARRFGVAVE